MADAVRPPRVPPGRRYPKTLSDVPRPHHFAGATHLSAPPDSGRPDRGPQRLAALETSPTHRHRPSSLLRPSASGPDGRGRRFFRSNRHPSSALRLSPLFARAHRVRSLGLDPADQFNPDSVRIARKCELIPIFFERLHLRVRPLRYDFLECVRDVAHPKREVVQLLPLAVASEEFAVRGIPVQLQPLRRVRAPQLDPDPTVAHSAPSGDLHPHHLPVELKGPIEVPDSNPCVEVLHNNPRPRKILSGP